MTDQQNSATAEESAQANDEALASAAADLRIAELETQLKDASERALRAQAELENYRKRAQRELADERRYAVVPLVRDLLPVVDNLQRAIDATPTRSASEAGTSSDTTMALASLLEGVQLVATQLEAVLKQHGCLPIETVGAPFDPNQHQAIAQEPSAEHPAGTVTRAAQVGYKLHDRVIRPAQVFVSTGPAK
ncbi:MAG: nucleotide exchange factor GrpE [Planctomycetaceae bacterium]|nr:nucleotide exchange factor GrpE [Planctomycetaceae bacterium]